MPYPFLLCFVPLGGSSFGFQLGLASYQEIGVGSIYSQSSPSLGWPSHSIECHSFCRWPSLGPLCLWVMVTIFPIAPLAWVVIGTAITRLELHGLRIYPLSVHSATPCQYYMTPDCAIASCQDLTESPCHIRQAWGVPDLVLFQKSPL